MLVHHGVGFFYLGMGGRSPREFECLKDVPTHVEVTVPKNLVGEGDGQLCTSIDVTLLELIVAASKVGVERDTLWQPLQVLCFDDVEPLRLAFQVLEGFPWLELGGVVVGEVELPVLFILVNGGFARLVTLAVTVAEGQVGRIPRHGITALYSRLPVAQREVLVLHDGLCEAAQRVACCRGLTLVEGYALHNSLKNNCTQ